MYIPLKTGVHIVNRYQCQSEYKDLDPEENRQFKVVIDHTVICAGEKKYWLNSEVHIGSDACQVYVTSSYSLKVDYCKNPNNLNPRNN